MNRIVLMVLRNLFKAPIAYLKLCHYAKHTDKYTEEEMYKHIRYIFDTAVKSGNIDLQVFGQENIPQENGYMMYSNHQGLFDILAITAACPRPWAAVLKKELKDVFLLKQMIACTKSFPMDREDIRQSMQVIQATADEVKKGRNYLIFPEGTRSKMGNRMLDFHGGSFKCATKARCPILPMVLVDSFKVLDQKGCKPVAVQVHFLKPIAYEEYKGMNTTEIAAMVRGRIDAVLSQFAEQE